MKCKVGDIVDFFNLRSTHDFHVVLAVNERGWPTHVKFLPTNEEFRDINGWNHGKVIPQTAVVKALLGIPL